MRWQTQHNASNLPISKALVGFFVFDQNGNAYDLSTRSINCTRYGNPLPKVTPVGDVISFANASTDYIDLGNYSKLSFEVNDNYTIIIEFAYTNFTTCNFFSKQLNSGNYTGWAIGASIATGWNVYVAHWNSPNGYVIAYPERYNDGTYHTVAYTYSGNNAASGFTLYVDGNPITGTVQNNTAPSTIASSAVAQINGRGGANLNLGQFNCSYALAFKRVLNANEIKAVTNNPSILLINPINSILYSPFYQRSNLSLLGTRIASRQGY